MNEQQKRDAARDFLRSAVMPLIEEVLVKKFCQTLDVIAEQNSEMLRDAGIVEWMPMPAPQREGGAE